MTREEILTTAREIICRDRNEQYGEPEDNFSIIAEYWSAYLNGKYRTGTPISSEDVANMMSLFKLGRITTSKNHKIDNYVDLAGYAACAAECAEEELRKIYSLAEKLKAPSEDAEKCCSRCSND